MKSRAEKQSLSLGSHWNKYVAAGAACVAAGVTAEQASADGFYSGVLNFNMTSPTAGSTAYTGLFTAINSSTVAIFAHARLSATQGAALFGALGSVAGFPANGYNYADNVPVNAVLSAQAFLTPASVFNTMAFAGGFTYSEFLTPGNKLVGFRFVSPAEATLHYGWARVNMGGAPLNAMTLVDWAYSDQAGFQAGQVPEPTSLGLLAVGALGLAAMRRRSA